MLRVPHLMILYHDDKCRNCLREKFCYELRSEAVLDAGHRPFPYALYQNTIQFCATTDGFIGKGDEHRLSEQERNLILLDCPEIEHP